MKTHNMNKNPFTILLSSTSKVIKLVLAEQIHPIPIVKSDLISPHHRDYVNRKAELEL